MKPMGWLASLVVVVGLALLLGWRDPYRWTFVVLAAIGIVVLEQVIRRGRTSTADDFYLPGFTPSTTLSREMALMLEEKSEGDPPLLVGIISFIRGIAVVILAAVLLWIVGLTPITGWYDDQGYAELVKDIELLESARSYEKIVEKVDERLRRPISSDKRRFLAEKKYNALIALGDQASSDDDKRRLYGEAQRWAEREGLDSRLAAEKAKPTATPPPPVVVTVQATAPPPVIVTVTATPTPRPAPGQHPGIAARIVQTRPEAAVTTMDISVTANGTFYDKLTAQDLLVYVNGSDEPVKLEQQTLTQFQALPDPVHYSIVIDRSESIRAQLDTAKQAAVDMIKGFRPVDRVRIISFGSNVTTSGFVTPNEAINLVNQIVITRGMANTALYDAMVAAGGNVPGYPHIAVILTDGEDTASRAKIEAAAQAMQGSILYLVGLASPDLKPAILQQLAAAAGGKYVPATPANLRQVFDEIRREAVQLYRLVVFLPGTTAQRVRIRIEPNTELTWPQ